jgi:ubiquinone/menaquinone biosynthesis C-methylase UbiE
MKIHRLLNAQQIVDVFDELPFWSAPFGLKLLEQVHYKKNLRVLDIGCGAGFPLTELAMRLGSNAVVYGIDPWKEAMDRLRMKLDYFDIKNVKLFDATAENIPLENQSLDLITSNNGINNVSNIQVVYQECARVLQSGGQFLQTMNTDKSMHEFYDLFKIILAEQGMEELIPNVNTHIYNKRKPINEIIQWMQSSGFEIVSLKEDSFRYSFVDGAALMEHYFIRLAFKDSWMDLLPVEKVTEIFEMVETRMNQHADQYGSISLTIPFILIDAFKK